MSAAAETTPDWKSWEGDRVDNEFSLEQFLGGGDKSGVFLTRLPSGNGAIKLVLAGGEQAQRLVERWSRAGALDHPNLIGLVKTGTWVKGDTPVAYVVTEFAEEILAAVLAERAITAEEALELLLPAADALAYLHQRGLAHGSLKASNVFAVKDTLKLSCDSVSAGDAAADMRALAETMVHALTQQPAWMQGVAGIESIPEPFPQIVRGCMGENGRAPWSDAQLGGWLRSQKRAPVARVSRSRTRRLSLTSYAAIFALILVAVVTVGSWLRNRTSAPVATAAPAIAKPVASPLAEPKAEPKKEPARAIEAPAAREPQPRSVLADAQQDVVRQVSPEIPADALRTVQGTATVVVRVAVNPSGEVTNATQEPGGSRYFGRLAVEAARQWRFVPGGGGTARQWSLRFEITRTETTVHVVRLG